MVELFVSDNCPYCVKVKKAFDETGIEATFRNISDPIQRDRLIKLGGKMQIPFLYIDNEVSMYESDDIIAYMKGRITTK